MLACLFVTKICHSDAFLTHCSKQGSCASCKHRRLGSACGSEETHPGFHSLSIFSKIFIDHKLTTRTSRIHRLTYAFIARMCQKGNFLMFVYWLSGALSVILIITINRRCSVLEGNYGQPCQSYVGYTSVYL